MNAKPMKKTKARKTSSIETDDMRPEYDLDFSKARPNRFATPGGALRVAVTLDPDVARVFTTAESVNTVLRALINSMPRDVSRD
jgi:hypothetical protein